MSDREHTTVQPEGGPPGATPWFQRMEGQSLAPPPTNPIGAASDPYAPPTAALPAVPGPERDGYAPSHAARPPRRRRSRMGAAASATVGAVVVLAAAVVAILFRDPAETPTTNADRSAESGAVKTKESVPALPSLGETLDPGLTTAPTDPGAEPTDTGAFPSETPTSANDLGLAVPMTPPACDGTWVVFIGSATDPATYEADVTSLLGRDPAAKYTLTQGGCSSMRQALPDGSLIYAVYVGPYPDQASACAVSTQLGSGAYVKRMDDTTPPEQLWAC